MGRDLRFSVAFCEASPRSGSDHTYGVLGSRAVSQEEFRCDGAGKLRPLLLLNHLKYRSDRASFLR